MTAIASRNPFDLLSDDGEPRGSPMTAVKTKGAASTASPAVNISSKSNTSAVAAQIKPKGDNNNNRNNNSSQRSGNNHYNNNNNKSDQKGERKPYVQRTPGPATGEGAIYEKFPKGSGSQKNINNGNNAPNQAARGPRAGRGGRANNDRHPNSGRRENEKRHGGGNANWGNEEQDAHKVEHLDANNASEALKEFDEGETGLDANGETITPVEKEQQDEKEEEEEVQLTLEEYKAQLAAKKASSTLPAARAPNQGEAIKGVTSNQRKEQEDFFVGKSAEKAKKEKAAKESKAKQFLEIEQKFNEASRPPRGENLDRRNSRGRGGNRGGRGGRGGNASGRGGRGGFNKANNNNTAPAADLKDDKLFPSLQR